jgi:hypothetical protein
MTHPDLVPWNRLTEEVKEKDREAVRLIPLLLATYAGFAIAPRTSLVSAPGGSEGRRAIR